MERIAAVKKLSKMLGRGFSYEVKPKAPDATERAAARVELVPVLEEHSRLERLLNERRRAVLEADTEYQRIISLLKAAKGQKERLNSSIYSYKFTVGNVDRIAGFGVFHVKAQGDSWEEVIDKLTKKEGA